jgi:hypothetical protein
VTFNGSARLEWAPSPRESSAPNSSSSADLPIDHVANKVGFSSGVSLGPHFRRIVGVSPQQYRATFRAASPAPDTGRRFDRICRVAHPAQERPDNIRSMTHAAFWDTQTDSVVEIELATNSLAELVERVLNQRSDQGTWPWSCAESTVRASRSVRTAAGGSRVGECLGGAI